MCYKSCLLTLVNTVYKNVSMLPYVYQAHFFALFHKIPFHAFLKPICYSTGDRHLDCLYFLAILGATSFPAYIHHKSLCESISWNTPKVETALSWCIHTLHMTKCHRISLPLAIHRYSCCSKFLPTVGYIELSNVCL